MSHLQLIRVESSSEATFGTLLIDSKLTCLTLEPPKRSNERNISCIPTGTYNYKIYHSNKYQCNCIKLFRVHNRSHISIHYGNYPRNTQGCILVGESKVLNTLMRSKAALKTLTSEITSTGILTIKEF